MAQESGVLKIDPLFVGLTRPPLFFGVSWSISIINSISCMLTFIQTSNFLSFLILFINHSIGYWICANEPLFLELWIAKMSKCGKRKNSLFHTANSYDFY